MRRNAFWFRSGLLVGLPAGLLALGSPGCSKSSEDKTPPAAGSQGASTAGATAGTGAAAGAGSGSAARPRIEQVAPPLPIKPPPADATKTASGLVYKKLVANEAGAQPKRNDSVLINYTGWRESGETFFTNKGRSQPFRLNLVHAAPGFTEALQLMHKGETAMLWMPAEIGYKAPPTKGNREALVYQLELVDIVPAPEVPEDVGKPPATATTLASGTKRVVVKPGTGKDKARQFDNVTYNYTVWNSDGKMLDTTTTRDRATTVAPYKESPALGEMLTSMTAGERSRFWVDAERTASNGRSVPGAQGVLCYEVEVQSIAKAAHEPPPTPPDVAKPPADAKKSPKGVLYRVLKAGTPKEVRHPTETDTVKVHYTGWTTDGRMFDSSMLRGEPATFNLKGVVAGWTDAIPLMTIGDRWRLWIPEPLAYKGQAGKPKGMLVFDVELLEIVTAAAH